MDKFKILKNMVLDICFSMMEANMLGNSWLVRLQVQELTSSMINLCKQGPGSMENYKLVREFRKYK